MTESQKKSFLKCFDFHCSWAKIQSKSISHSFFQLDGKNFKLSETPSLELMVLKERETATEGSIIVIPWKSIEISVDNLCESQGFKARLDKSALRPDDLTKIFKNATSGLFPAIEEA